MPDESASVLSASGWHRQLIHIVLFGAASTVTLPTPTDEQNGGIFARLPPALTTLCYPRLSTATAVGPLSASVPGPQDQGREGPPTRSTTYLLAEADVRAGSALAVSGGMRGWVWVQGRSVAYRSFRGISDRLTSSVRSSSTRAGLRAWRSRAVIGWCSMTAVTAPAGSWRSKYSLALARASASRCPRAGVAREERDSCLHRVSPWLGGPMARRPGSPADGRQQQPRTAGPTLTCWSPRWLSPARAWRRRPAPRPRGLGRR